MVTLIVALALGGEPCAATASPDAPFAAAPPTALDDVRLVVEVWADAAPGSWVSAVATTLRDHGASGLFVLRPERAAALADAVAGHAVAVDLRAGVPDTGDPSAEAAALAAQARRIRGAVGTRPVAVLSPFPRRADEATLSLAGFPILLDHGTATGAAPRLAARFTGARGGAVVLPPSPGAGACALTPWAPFRPDAADRATRALRAAGGGGLAVVRVVLDGRAAAPEDAAVLGRWLDTLPIAPADVRALPKEIRHTPVRDRAEPVGRLVPLSDLRATADALVAARGTLPRALPGGLSPTEAWLGLVLLLADRSDGETLRLTALRGPSNDARSELTGEVRVSKAVVLTLAGALAASLPGEIPSALSVGDLPLTAAELLLLLASAARGDDPATTRPIAVPEPNQRGLGWGESTVP